MASWLDSWLGVVNGVPVHPLLVHIIVVLLPLSCAGAVIMVISRRFSRRYGPLVVAVAVLGIVGSLLAKASGERLIESIPAPQQHVTHGTWLPLFVTGYAMLLLVFWLLDRGIPMNRPRPWWLIALGIVMLISALVALWWTVITGDSGARVAWEILLDSAR